MTMERVHMRVDTFTFICYYIIANSIKGGMSHDLFKCKKIMFKRLA